MSKEKERFVVSKGQKLVHLLLYTRKRNNSKTKHIRIAHAV
jgi:hypothetical protein